VEDSNRRRARERRITILPGQEERQIAADGSELLRPILERFNLIDRQRRERN